MTLLALENVGKTFTIHHLNKKTTALENLSFQVKEGEFLGIVGRSGSGKSTILKLIYRSYLPEDGEIWYDSTALGRVNLFDLTEREMLLLRKNEIGYVSQFLKVIPRITAKELVEQSLHEINLFGEEAERRAEAILRHFDLGPSLWNQYPVTFSGGEKLRLNIACAVVKRPRLLLLDEPTASLDEAAKVKVREAIEKLKQQGTTMIGIFHDLSFMEGLCDHVFTLESKKGEAHEN